MPGNPSRLRHPTRTPGRTFCGSRRRPHPSCHAAWNHCDCLGLALQSTLGDLFSGISLSIERPFQLGDQILLEGGVEGEVIELNWRATHVRNGANDIVVIPNSAIAKMRIQNHSAGSKRHSESLTVVVDSRNEPDMMIELLKQAAMTCPSVLESPEPSVSATAFQGDRITYAIYFNASTFASAGDARTELITQLYKRASTSFSSPGIDPITSCQV